MKLLKKFCCMELPAGTILWGVLGILSAVLNIIIKTYELSKSDESRYNESVQNYNFSKDGEIENTMTIVMSVINLITSGLLIVGAVTRNHFYLLPWLIQSGIGLLLACIGYPILMVVLIIISFPMGAIFFIFILCGLVLALAVYVFMGVYSCYVQLQGDRRQNHQNFEFLNTDRSIPKV